MPSNMKYAHAKAQICRSPRKNAFRKVRIEFPASVSADSVLTVSRTVKLGQGTYAALYGYAVQFMFSLTK